MRSSGRELWLALGAILPITVCYALVSASGTPRSSGLLGHGLGVAGFVLMLMTETLYSLRKRSRMARWGRMSNWLQFHIFTGLVGPYLVLLHTAWRYNGLAGAVSLLTVVVVASGVLGRYIYTAIPRTADGAEMAAEEVQAAMTALETELQRWRAMPAVELAAAGPFSGVSRRPDGRGAAQSRELQRLQARYRRLQRQRASLVAARRALALWHTVHVPIGITLFTAAFIHIGAALFYATLLH